MKNLYSRKISLIQIANHGVLVYFDECYIMALRYYAGAWYTEENGDDIKLSAGFGSICDAIIECLLYRNE